MNEAAEIQHGWGVVAGDDFSTWIGSSPIYDWWMIIASAIFRCMSIRSIHIYTHYHNAIYAMAHAISYCPLDYRFFVGRPAPHSSNSVSYICRRILFHFSFRRKSLLPHSKPTLIHSFTASFVQSSSIFSRFLSVNR
jgi:hypothetical protein